MAAITEEPTQLENAGSATVALTTAVEQNSAPQATLDATQLLQAPSPLFTSTINAQSTTQDGTIVFAAPFTPFMYSQSQGPTKMHHLSLMFDMFKYSEIVVRAVSTKSSITGAKFLLCWVHITPEELEQLSPKARVTLGLSGDRHSILEPSNEGQGELVIPWLYETPWRRKTDTYGTLAFMVLHRPTSTAESGNQTDVHITGTIAARGPFHFRHPHAPEGTDNSGEFSVNSAYRFTSPDEPSTSPDSLGRDVGAAVSKWMATGMHVAQNLALAPRDTFGSMSPYDIAPHVTPGGVVRGGFRTLLQLIPDHSQPRKITYVGTRGLGDPGFSNIQVDAAGSGIEAAAYRWKTAFKSPGELVVNNVGSDACLVLHHAVDAGIRRVLRGTVAHVYNEKGHLQTTFTPTTPEVEDVGEGVPVVPTLVQHLLTAFGDTGDACAAHNADPTLGGTATHFPLWTPASANTVDDAYSVVSGSGTDTIRASRLYLRHLAEVGAAHDNRDILESAQINVAEGTRGFWKKVGSFFTKATDWVVDHVAEPVAHAVVGAVAGRDSTFTIVPAGPADPPVVYSADGEAPTAIYHEQWRPDRGTDRAWP